MLSYGTTDVPVVCGRKGNVERYIDGMLGDGGIMADTGPSVEETYRSRTVLEKFPC